MEVAGGVTCDVVLRAADVDGLVGGVSLEEVGLFGVVSVKVVGIVSDGCRITGYGSEGVGLTDGGSVC